MGSRSNSGSQLCSCLWMSVVARFWKLVCSYSSLKIYILKILEKNPIALIARIIEGRDPQYFSQWAEKDWCNGEPYRRVLTQSLTIDVKAHGAQWLHTHSLVFTNVLSSWQWVGGSSLPPVIQTLVSFHLVVLPAPAPANPTLDLWVLIVGSRKRKHWVWCWGLMGQA